MSANLTLKVARRKGRGINNEDTKKRRGKQWRVVGRGHVE